MISITVEDRNGDRQNLDIPKDISLSLLEVLKAYDYNILATCGGIALCATCHVQILEGLDKLSSPCDAELDMLDTLPDAAGDSRLSCQLRINEDLDGMIVRIRGDEN